MSGKSATRPRAGEDFEDTEFLAARTRVFRANGGSSRLRSTPTNLSISARVTSNWFTQFETGARRAPHFPNRSYRPKKIFGNGALTSSCAAAAFSRIPPDL